MAKFIEQTQTTQLVVSRLEKYFDWVYVDEVQDFGGHDFNLLMKLSAAEANWLLVGDFYQHTYDTSRDGNVNKSLFDDFDEYRKRFETAGLRVDCERLNTSHRCSKNVCDFITNQLGIEIRSHDEHQSNVHFEEDPVKVRMIYEDASTVKLFLQEHYKYSCYSQNWGAAKGNDRYQNVCVVLNKSTWNAWKARDLRSINRQTKNKLYVACSRARGDLFFVPEATLSAFKANRESHNRR